MFDLNDFDNTGIDTRSDEQRAIDRMVDEWIASDGFEPADEELLDIAAIMAAHDENPWG